MSIFEFIGFLIVILALFAPLLRRLLEKRAEKRNPEEYARRRREAEEKEKEALRQLLTQLGQEIPPELREHEEARPEPEPEPLPAAPVQQTRRPMSTVAKREFHSRIEESVDLSNIDERELGVSIEADQGRHLISEQYKVRDEVYGFRAPKKSTIQKLIRGSSGKQMVLLREILEPPVSLR